MGGKVQNIEGGSGGANFLLAASKIKNRTEKDTFSKTFK